ncbi:metallophosphoesterase [Armatimonas sp.]|uniref:metallophosphoesterase n=1 Tax=Armatimonas sp. TaxID=1872638 RepID=UPI00286BF5E8|nr:metallophosphoesterase [Armatimonas sp.]
MSKKQLGIATGAALAAAYYALKIEPLLVEVTHTELFLPRLPASWDGLKVLFLSDPHVTEFGERERRVVELCGALETPDLILWGGDFLGSYQGVVPAVQLVTQIAQLFPGTPAFAVWGNAEHKIRRERRAWLEALLAEVGVCTLTNESLPFTLRGETITIAGCDDPYYGFADLDATFAKLTPERFTLFVAHSPQVAALAARAGVDLMLSGHTHGGQVRFPIIGPWKTQNPLSRLLDCGAFSPKRLTEILGYDPGGELTTYISRGIGLAFIPRLPWLAPRFNCRPEVACLTLRPLSPRPPLSQ